MTYDPERKVAQSPCKRPHVASRAPFNPSPPRGFLQSSRVELNAARRLSPRPKNNPGPRPVLTRQPHQCDPACNPPPARARTWPPPRPPTPAAALPSAPGPGAPTGLAGRHGGREARNAGMSRGRLLRPRRPAALRPPHSAVPLAACRTQKDIAAASYSASSS